MVRAKFKVTHKTPHLSNVPDAEVGTVTLSAVHSDVNKEWSVWTPSGTIEMRINNPSAYEAFKLGKEYFIDFTPVE